jgi:predicted small lipoprotein YifL
MKTKFLISCLALVIFALGLTACGKRGGPFPPSDSEKTYPRKYPMPEEK